MNSFDSGVLLGHQRPRIQRLPSWGTALDRGNKGDVIPPALGRLGREIVDLASLTGLILDPWQAWIMEQAHVIRPDLPYFNPYTGRNEYLWGAKEVGVMVSRQNGKGPLAVTTPILTVDGWTSMGAIQAGAQVYGADGAPLKVVGVSETYLDDTCYEVEFSDGSKIVAGEDHLWHVRNKKASELWRNMRTADLATRVGGRRNDNGRMEYNWRVRCDAVIDSAAADLPIDPYLLGYWLGDGTAASARITVGHEDRDWLTDRIAATGATVDSFILHDHGNAWSFGFHVGDKHSRDGFRGRAAAMGILNAKRIPEVYLTASVAQRKALLAGLMDSDGSIASTNKSPQVEFATSIPKLAADFQRLARSLGVRVTPKIGAASLDGIRKKDRTRFLWTPTFNPFQMPRKADHWVAPMSKRHELMSIVSIKRVPTVPTRCIQVDSEDGVYLVGHNFTPTHNSIIEARELAGLFIFGERLIIHSAHQADTSFEAFERIVHLIEETPALNNEVLKVGRSHGAEGIELHNGQRLRFRTRTKGGGRGFTGDCLILDEAMYLGSQQISALMPTLSARPNPQIWVTGSAGDKESTHFGKLRQRAMSVEEDPLLFYAEWSIDGCNDFCSRPNPDGTFTCEQHDDPSTVDSFAKANPGLGIRISVEHVEMERRSMDTKSFLQERLGVGDWPTEGNAWRVIGQDSWMARVDETSDIQGRMAFAIDTTPDGETSCITAAGYNSGGDVHVEVTGDGDGLLYHKPGTTWVVPLAKEMWKRHKPYCFVIDKAGQAGMFVTELEDAGIKVVCPNSREFAQSCAEFKTAVVPKKGEEAYLAHIDQAPLNAAVAGSDIRELTDMWAWSKAASSVDISPLVSATLAMWGLKQESAKPRFIPMAFYG